MCENAGFQPACLTHASTVFDLPPELLATLHARTTLVKEKVRSSLAEDSERAESPDKSINPRDNAASSTTCLLCNVSSASFQEQRLHGKSDWHNYNLKEKLRGRKPVTEAEFEKLLDDLEESLSGTGSDSSDSESDDAGHDRREGHLSTLFKRQANLHGDEAETENFATGRKKRGSGSPPLIWFSSPSLPAETSLGVYRALLTVSEQAQTDPVEVLRNKQLKPVSTRVPAPHSTDGVPLPSTMTSPSIFMCMIGGGHFAAMVVSLAPKQASGSSQRQAIVLAHKTFHRYTTRRKQGGGQAANDAAKGAAHSAGSSLRRYNEVALEQEIRALLSEWKNLIAATQLIFIRATGSQNRRILFGPYENQVLHQNDARNRTFPFSTRRATQAELMRSFVELTRLKVSRVDEAALAAAAGPEAAASPRSTVSSTNRPSPSSKPPAPQSSPEEQEALHHTSQLQSLIRRSKAPALITYMTSHSLPPSYRFHPPTHPSNHHASTPLHLASSNSHPAIISALLQKLNADPTIPNSEGRPAFDLAGDSRTRDAFRVARHELGEGAWDWEKAHVASGMSAQEAGERAERERNERERVEMERRRGEEERLKREGPVVPEAKGPAAGRKAEIRKTGEERREEEGRGMSEEVKRRMEREKRARAVEARMKRLGG